MRLDAPVQHAHLVLGQTAVVGLERQRVRQALLAGRNRLADIQVEERHVAQPLAASRTNGVLDGLGGQVVVDHQRHVLQNGREARDGLVAPRLTVRQQEVEIQLQHSHRLVRQIEALAHLRVHVTGNAEGFAANGQGGGARRVQGGVGGGGKAYLRHVETLYQGVDDALEMRPAKLRRRVVVPRVRQQRATEGDAEIALLQRQFLAGLRPVQPSDLEQRHALAIAPVRAQGFQQAGQQRLPQELPLLTDRIGQANVILGHRRRPLGAGAVDAVQAGQGIGEDFGQAAADQDVAGLLQALQVRLRALRRQHVADQRRRDLIIAVDAGDFLDQVGGFGHVEAVARHGDFQAGIAVLVMRRTAKLQRRQNTCHIGGAECHAQDARDLRGAQRDGLAAWRRRVGIGDFGVQGAAAQGLHEPGGAQQGGDRQVGVHPAAEALRRFAVQAQLLGGAADVDEIEIRRLQKDVPRALGHLGRRAAHDTGQGNGAGVIGDQQHVGTQLTLDAVQGLQRFARLRPPHHDAALQRLVVESMQGLARFEHDVIGDVHDVVDRALAGVLQTSLHPRRGRLDGDVLDQRSRVAGAQVRVGTGHGAVCGGGGKGAGGITGRPAAPGLAGEGGDFPRQADDTVGARQVGRQFDLQNGIAQRVLQRLPHRQIGVENEHAGVIVGQAQFPFRAHHAGRLHAADAGAAERLKARRLAVPVP